MTALWQSIVGLAVQFVPWLFTKRPSARQQIALPQAVALPLPPEAPPAEVIRLERLPPLMPTPKRRVAKDFARDAGGTYFYLDNLLDQLPKCRQLMRKMRAVDREAYDYNSRLGARVMPEFNLRTIEVPSAFLEKLPSAGMIFVPPSKHDDKPTKGKSRYDGVFTYFQKLTKRPWNMVAPKDEAQAIYRCTCVYVRKDKSGATGAQFLIALIDGVPRLISERIVERTGAGFHRQRWGYPAELEWWFTHNRPLLVKSHGEDTAMLVFGESVHEFAGILFAKAAMQYTASAAEHFQVRAERDGISIGFSVGLGRTPYFFRDRDRTVNADGATRRIFHRVEPHHRTLANGKVVNVKGHYRGLRRFTWKGEKVVITAPEWSQFTIDVDAREYASDESIPSLNKDMAPAEAAGLFRRFLEADESARKNGWSSQRR